MGGGGREGNEGGNIQCFYFDVQLLSMLDLTSYGR